MSPGAGTTEALREAVEAMPEGELFTPAQLLHLGPRNAVDKALSRLAQSGSLMRVTRGVFVRPRFSRHVGPVPPTPEAVVKLLAHEHGAAVVPHGAVIANRLGLSTQVPVQPLFLTTGPARRFAMGKLMVTMLKTAPRKLALGERPAGEALCALWYLGADEVTPAVVGVVRARLGETEFAALTRARHLMPGWMSDTFHRYDLAHKEPADA